MAPSPLLLAATLLLAALLALLLLRKPGGARRSSAGGAGSAVEAPEGAETRETVALFFGTQTGTAEKFAKLLAAEIGRRYPLTARAVVKDLDSLSEHNALGALRAARVTLLLQATYGDGEATDSAAAFLRWATESASACTAAPGPLTGCHVAVFGLGNRQYEHFNAAAKALDGAMAGMGASRLCAVGLGDDDGSLEDDFAAWRAQLWPALENALPNIAGPPEAAAERRASEDGLGPAAVLSYDAVVSRAGSVPCAPAWGEAHAPGVGAYDARRPFLARLAARRELHGAGSERSCMHVELDLEPEATGLRYESGDHLGVLPENDPLLVAQALKRLGWKGSELVTLRLPPGSPLPEPFPTPCALKDALSRHADLQSPPRRAALAALAAHCSDPTQAAALSELASPAGKERYAEYVTAPARSLLELLAAFPAAAPPVGVFFGAVAPRLAVRYYSISSSPRAYPGHAHLTMALVLGPTPTGRLHRGVATTHLATRAPLLSRVPVFLRASAFRLPRSPATPIVMLGPGTGLAPFRAFAQERAALAATGAALGPALLFFGCRAAGLDDIYAPELAALAAAGALSHIELCYSRAPGAVRRYVQHALAEQGAQVWELLARRGGHFYVCGDAKAMAKDVHAALLGLARSQGGLEAGAAEAWAAGLAKEGRYSRDVW